MLLAISRILLSLTLGLNGSAALQTSAATPADEEKSPVAEVEQTADEEQTKTDAGDEPQRWLLRYQFRDGQQLRYVSDQESTVDAQAGGARKTDVSKVKQQRLFTVNEVTDEEVAHLVMQFEHVRMQIQSDDKPPVVFDTSMAADEVPKLFQQAAHRLGGSAAKYRLTTTGLTASSGDSDSAVETEFVDANSFLIPLPEAEVAIGDTWKVESKVKVRVTAEISRHVVILRTFRLKDVRDGIASISFDSSVMSRTPSVTVRAQLIQATPKGDVEFDIERGLMLKREIRFDQTVLGALGPQTVLASWGKTTERLLDTPEPATTSSR
jgi:hypothetical protein